MARQRSGRRTDYTWSNFGDVMSGQDLSTGTSVVGVTGSAIGTAETIVRIRGKVGVVLDTGGVDESAMILCGLTIMSDDAFASAVAPELFTNGNDDGSWFWQGALYVNSGAEGAVINEFLSATIEVDTRAMRKVKPHQVIVFVFQSAAQLVSDQAGTYDLTYFFHCLGGS